MIPAFWDTSALVPICVRQESSARVRELLVEYSLVVWWGTAVEMRSAIARLNRTGELNAAGVQVARFREEELLFGWYEVQPSEAVRTQAEKLLRFYFLRAADALQVAAAWVWSSEVPQRRTFIAGDAQVLAAAEGVGFHVVPTAI